MPIHVVCRCGRYMALPEKFLGRKAPCPDCDHVLRIPTTEEDRTLIRWDCACGLRLKARPRMAGRKTQCPRCNAENPIPLPAGVDSFIEKRFAEDGQEPAVAPQLDAPDDVPAPSPRTSDTMLDAE